MSGNTATCYIRTSLWSWLMHTVRLACALPVVFPLHGKSEIHLNEVAEYSQAHVALCTRAGGISGEASVARKWHSGANCATIHVSVSGEPNIAVHCLLPSADHDCHMFRHLCHDSSVPSARTKCVTHSPSVVVGIPIPRARHDAANGRSMPCAHRLDNIRGTSCILA